MNAQTRRMNILDRLKNAAEPVSASQLARELGVSRQIIVGDVALLRATGERIAATPRGYVLEQEETGILRRIACCHADKKTETELMICVSNGCSVLDVSVEHPIYGELTGSLQLASPYDVRQFIRQMEEEAAHALSELTDGIHLHTLSCPNEAAFRRVLEELDQAGILLKNEA